MESYRCGDVGKIPKRPVSLDLESHLIPAGLERKKTLVRTMDEEAGW